jgi:hypothetical protein
MRKRWGSKIMLDAMTNASVHILSSQAGERMCDTQVSPWACILADATIPFRGRLNKKRQATRKLRGQYGSCGKKRGRMAFVTTE